MVISTVSPAAVRVSLIIMRIVDSSFPLPPSRLIRAWAVRILIQIQKSLACCYSLGRRLTLLASVSSTVLEMSSIIFS